MSNTPDSPAETPDHRMARVETFGRCLPPESGKFCTLFYSLGTRRESGTRQFRPYGSLRGGRSNARLSRNLEGTDDIKDLLAIARRLNIG